MAKDAVGKCECGYRFGVVRVWPFHCACGRVYGEREIKPASTQPWAIERRIICEECPQYLPVCDRCGFLVAIGKPGLLTHSRGIANPLARCADYRNRRWEAVDPDLGK